MISQYRFLKVREGICFFAAVWVEVIPEPAENRVVVAIPDNVNPDDGEVTLLTGRSWVLAAHRGAQLALDLLSAIDMLESKYLVKILKVVGTDIDTTEDVVLCSAALATCEAIAPQKPLFELVFDGTWRLQNLSSQSC